MLVTGEYIVVYGSQYVTVGGIRYNTPRHTGIIAYCYGISHCYHVCYTPRMPVGRIAYRLMVPTNTSQATIKSGRAAIVYRYHYDGWRVTSAWYQRLRHERRFECDALLV